MHRSVKSVIFSAILAGMALGAPAAKAAVHEGIWSVLIVTEKGECDRGYRYEVKVANGHISYNGDAPSISPARSRRMAPPKSASSLASKARPAPAVWRGAAAPAPGTASARLAAAPGAGKRS